MSMLVRQSIREIDPIGACLTNSGRISWAASGQVLYRGGPGGQQGKRLGCHKWGRRPSRADGQQLTRPRFHLSHRPLSLTSPPARIPTLPRPIGGHTHTHTHCCCCCCCCCRCCCLGGGCRCSPWRDATVEGLRTLEWPRQPCAGFRPSTTPRTHAKTSMKRWPDAQAATTTAGLTPPQRREGHALRGHPRVPGRDGVVEHTHTHTHECDKKPDCNTTVQRHRKSYNARARDAQTL